MTGGHHLRDARPASSRKEAQRGIGDCGEDQGRDDERRIARDRHHLQKNILRNLTHPSKNNSRQTEYDGACNGSQPAMDGSDMFASQWDTNKLAHGLEIIWNVEILCPRRRVPCGEAGSSAVNIDLINVKAMNWLGIRGAWK